MLYVFNAQLMLFTPYTIIIYQQTTLILIQSMFNLTSLTETENFNINCLSATTFIVTTTLFIKLFTNKKQQNVNH